MSIRPSAPLRCDVFCNVIDNFGDAGVCWRLVRELAAVTDWTVRLVIDRPELVTRLRSATDAGPPVVAWSDDFAPTEVADIVIEAFGCRLPETYLGHMRRQARPPVWINLEYLSAEPWIEGCHGLPSPDPASGIAKYFYFPGFSAKSGGLIREARLDALLGEMKDVRLRTAWLRLLGIETNVEHCLVSLFCYADSPFGELLQAWQSGPRPVHCLLAAGLPEPELHAMERRAAAARVRTSRLPFLCQDDYDRLLAACEVNFVRGEDSFVRAQWMGPAFVWQAYRQSEATHLAKLAAFLNCYLPQLSHQAAAAVRSLHQAWNGDGEWTPLLWADFLAQRPAIVQHNRRWAGMLASHGNLAENLAAFCKSKL